MGFSYFEFLVYFGFDTRFVFGLVFVFVSCLFYFRL